MEYPYDQNQNLQLKTTLMRMLVKILPYIFCLFSINGINAQPEHFGEPILPLQQNRSPLFGKDIVINDSSSQNQRQVVVRSAFNGWLYAEYSAIDPFYNTPVSTVMKSVDNGITWTVLINLVWPGPYKSFISTDMAVSGDSISNLKLFLAWVASISSDPSAGRGDAYVWRYNGITGDYEDGLLLDSPVVGIALATDFMYPATNSNPHSLGVLYTKTSISIDSIIFRSSSNGGISFDNRRGLASSAGRIFKVALAYGRSPSWNSGRYFAVWEEKEALGSALGHIYTAHTDPNFNSPFTSPVNLDGLDATDFNMCRNPSIACQYNNTNNDSSNLTEIILFERKKQSDQMYNIKGCYNLQATTTSHFKKLNFSDSLHNNMQPSINFNPFDSTFMVTYYDSSSQKLPYLINNFNLLNPDAWQLFSSGYNDSGNLVDPYPMVALNIGQQQGANVWSGEGTGENGIAMFDSPYSTWTGISENITTDDSQLFRVYPNPCNSSLIIALNLKKAETVKITLYNQIGETMGIVADRSYSGGQSLINYNVSDFSPGSYLLTFIGGNVAQTRKVFIVR